MFRKPPCYYTTPTGKHVYPWKTAISLEQSFLTRLGCNCRISKHDGHRCIPQKFEISLVWFSCKFHWLLIHYEKSLSKLSLKLLETFHSKLTDDKFCSTENKLLITKRAISLLWNSQDPNYDYFCHKFEDKNSRFFRILSFISRPHLKSFRKITVLGFKYHSKTLSMCRIVYVPISISALWSALSS